VPPDHIRASPSRRRPTLFAGGLTQDVCSASVERHRWEELRRACSILDEADASKPQLLCSLTRSGACRGSTERCATDETRNSGEIDREVLLRPEAKVVLGRAVRRCWPTARFVRFLQPEAADPNRRTYRRAPRRGRRRAALRSWLPNLVPTHDRGPRPPRRRSTWLLLSPNLERPAAAVRTIALSSSCGLVARSRWPKGSSRSGFTRAAVRLLVSPKLERPGPGPPRACGGQETGVRSARQRSSPMSAKQ